MDQGIDGIKKRIRKIKEDHPTRADPLSQRKRQKSIVCKNVDGVLEELQDLQNGKFDIKYSAKKSGE